MVQMPTAPGPFASLNILIGAVTATKAKKARAAGLGARAFGLLKFRPCGAVVALVGMGSRMSASPA